MGLAGRVALITGAASGIGAETARGLAGRGLRLALVDVDAGRLADVAASLPTETVRFEADVTDRDAVQAAVDGTAGRFGSLDIVIANAGIERLDLVAAMPPERFERVLEVNLVGLWNTLRAALPAVARRDGYLLATASIAAAIQVPPLGAYNASKAGVHALVNTLRFELATTGVDVGAAYFGIVDTEMRRRAVEHPLLDLIRQSDLELIPPIRVTRAADAMVDAVVHRRRRVVEPKVLAPALWFPAAYQRLMERLVPLASDLEAIGRISTGR